MHRESVIVDVPIEVRQLDRHGTDVDIMTRMLVGVIPGRRHSAVGDDGNIDRKLAVLFQL